MREIKYYEKPKKITIGQLLEDRQHKLYIEKFEYGDFDNWVTAVIENIRFEFDKKKDGTYSVWLEDTWTRIENINKPNINPTVSYGCIYGSFRTIDEVMEHEITVIGEYA